MAAVIGIDLGTTTTVAAVFRNGKRELIPNEEGSFVTPSAVGIDENGDWVVGAKARGQYGAMPGCTAIEMKRNTGKDVITRIGNVRYTPVQLQARLLAYVRQYASDYLGEEVRHAVISVPSYYGDLQRRDTIRAGEMAGFEVERILNEPAAAAISYGFDHMKENGCVMVYDFGGGSFDVKMLEMFDGRLKVRSSYGTMKIGGRDFDEEIMEYLFRHFQNRYDKNLRRNPRAVARIKEEAEKCKILLSEREFCHIWIPDICTIEGKPVALEETISRKQFYYLARPLVEYTHTAISHVLKKSHIDREQIDHLILVGGITKMPLVAEDIKTYLGIEPVCDVDPEFAVAEGTAVQAGIISGEIDPEDGLSMTDVSAHTLGIRISEDGNPDIMCEIIPRNAPLPAAHTERFETISRNQTDAVIEIYQGESRIASHNALLGKFRIRNIPAQERGREKLDIIFSCDENGLLKVLSRVASTGEKKEIEIDLEQEREKTKDRSAWKEAKDAERFLAIIQTTEEVLASGYDIPEQLDTAARSLMDELKSDISREDRESADAARRALEDVLVEILSDCLQKQKLKTGLSWKEIMKRYLPDSDTEV